MIKITITLDDAGNVSLEGIPGNQVTALGILEIAKVAIGRMATEQNRRVEPAGIAFPRDMKLT